MDNESYEQLHVAPAALGDASGYLIESSTAILQMYDGEIIGVDLPAAVELDVDRDRARRAGRPRVGRPQARNARDRDHGAGAAVREHRRARQGRHPHRRVPHASVSTPEPPQSVERRREARERALALLYEAEAKGVAPAELVASLPVAPDPFAVELVTGWATPWTSSTSTSAPWPRAGRVARMPAIDRALLRVGCLRAAPLARHADGGRHQRGGRARQADSRPTTPAGS